MLSSATRKIAVSLHVLFVLIGNASFMRAEMTDSFALTAEEQSYLDSIRTRPITIAYSYDLINAEFDGESYGIIEPVLDILRNNFGIAVNLVKTNWHDAFTQVENGEIDFYGPIAISESRREKYITIDPFYRRYSKVVTRVDEPVNSMMGLYNRPIGLLEGSVISRTLQTYLGPYGKVIYYTTMDDMIRGLKDGAIDAFATVDNAEYEILANDGIRFEFSIDNSYVDQGFISGCEDMRMLASLLSRYLKTNPEVSEDIAERRHQALLRYSKERLPDEIAYIQENYREMTLYVDASMYPLCYFENGNVKGMLLEIIEIFEGLTGVKMRFCTDKDIKDGAGSAFDKLATGEIMAIAGGYYDIDTWNDSDIEYSPLLWMETLRTYSYKSNDDLHGKTIGATKCAVDYLGWNNTSNNAPVLYNSYQEVMDALKQEEIDAVFMGEMRFNYSYSMLKDYSLREVTGISAEAPIHMLYGMQNKEFNALFNEVMTLFHILKPQSMAQWKSLTDMYKSEYIRMRSAQQAWTIVIFVVFTIMLAALIFLFIRNLKSHKNTKERLVDVLDKVHFDELTGIYNRRFLDENLNRVINTISRSGGALSVMMLDVDFFKRFNDTYGHGEGDTCLREVATAIKDSLSRSDDYVARYGGEEFVVVLPNTSESGARFIANKILQNVRACSIPHEKNSAADYVTISIGVTTGNILHAQSGCDYIKRADEALYMSKQSGRDRYTFLDFWKADNETEEQ